MAANASVGDHPDRDCPRCGATTEVRRSSSGIDVRNCTDPDCVWYVYISGSNTPRHTQ